MHGKSPINFHSQRLMTCLNHTSALSADADFGFKTLYVLTPLIEAAKDACSNPAVLQAEQMNYRRSVADTLRLCC